MKKKFTLIILLVGLNTIAQAKFEKGYFIKNNGDKVECLIKNKGWVNTPQIFEYRISNSSLTQTGLIKNIKEFGFKDIAKFKRFETKIDRSSRKYNSLDKSRLSNFKKETIFLEVIIESDIQFLQYQKDGLIRFFYIKENESIKPLEYKLYNNSGRVLKNINYIKQLRDNFFISNYNFTELTYTKKDLSKFFVKYLEINKLEYKKYSKEKNYKATYNLKLKVKNSFVSLIYANDKISPGVKLDSENQFKFGFEFEMILPINNNKWGVFIEPTYQSFNSYKEIKANDAINNTYKPTTVYKSIEIPIGVRHYLFLNKKSKIFINAGLVADITFSSSTDIKRFNYGFLVGNPIDPSQRNYSLTIYNSTNFFLGFGYSYSKFNIEFRLNSDRAIAYSQGTILSYNSYSTIISYSLF
tara:strand:- start:14032 stop:15267 length:1236 start_codon:yes stop_codon:yes gene_type:complete